MSFVVTEPLTEGVVVLHTSIGDILIELWKRECPKAVRNFVQLCLEGHYDGVPFHRIVPGFIAQTGGGDDCIYDDGSFPVEANQRLKFNRRGLVAMAADPTTKSNSSQFFFTLDATPELQNKHTLFGRVTGDSLFNLLKLSDVELEPGSSDRPVYAPTIRSAEVRVDPFADSDDPIRPRITAAERKEQERAKREMKAERARERQQGKRKGTKNKALLSFGGDEPEGGEAADDASLLPKTKFKSAHDALHDARLSKTVLDDRGLSATLPEDLVQGGAAAQAAAAGARDDKGKKRAADEGGRDEKRHKAETGVTLEQARKMKADKAGKTDAERRKDEIAKLQAELTKSSRPSDDAASTAKKPKRTGPSLLQLEREKYLRGAAKPPIKGKRRAGGGGGDDDDDVLSALEGFRSKLFEAGRAAPAAKKGSERQGEDDEGRLHGIDLNDDELDDDDEGWMAHSLKFRKDATMDRHTADEYELVDPLAKNALTLDEIRAKADSGRRRYPAESRGEGSSSRGGGGGGGGGGRERYDAGGRGGGERYGGGGGRDRPGDGGFGGSRGDRARGDWKQDRVSTMDLA
ncbi:hypothetical protein JCM3775_004268 [Rhodotorula graminis]